MILKDCLELIIDNRGRNPKYYDNEAYPVIDNVMIKNNYHPNIKEATRFINQDTHDNFLRGYLEPNIPIMTLVGGGIGNVSLSIDDKSVIVQNTIGFKTKAEILDSIYLYYWFLYKHDELIQFNRGSGQPSIRKTDIENMNIELKSINYQRKVSKILSEIDEKIALNNEINNNLYDISKQLLLKYLAENNNSEEINISELLNVFTGKKNANETTPTGKYKFFSCAPESLLSDTYLYDGAAIIVAGNGAYTGRTRFYDGKFELYQRTYGLTLKEGLNKNNIYGLYVFMKAIFEPDKMGGTHGSAIPYIVLSDLTNYKLKYNKKEFNKFSNLVSYNIKIIQENEKSNEQLEQLRDTLLPKLMNGEINLDNIEI